MRTGSLVLAIAILAASNAHGVAQRGEAPAGWAAIRLDELHWTKSGAIEIAPVFGRRDQAELFAMAARFPPHTARKAHSHPALRYAVVLSGIFYHGHGDRFDNA